MYEQGGGNPFYLEQLARTGGARAVTRSAGGDPGRHRGLGGRGAHHRWNAEARLLLESAAVAGDPFEPDVAAEIAGARRRGVASTRSTSCSPRTSSARRTCHAGSSSGIRCCGGPSTRGRRAAGGSARTGAPPRRCGTRRAGHRARTSRRVRGAPGRRRGDRAAHRGGRGEHPPRAGRRGRMPPCRAAAAAGIGRRATGVGPARAGAGAARVGAARGLPGDAPGGDRAGPRGRRSASHRAHDPLRRRRALARPASRRPTRACCGPGSGCPATMPTGAPRSGSSWPSTACSIAPSTARSRWAKRRSTPRGSSGDRRWWARRPPPCAWRRRRRAHRLPRGGIATSPAASSTGSPTRSSRRARTSLYHLGWAENYLEHYDAALAHVDRHDRDRAPRRRHPAARPDDARQVAIRWRRSVACRRRPSCATAAVEATRLDGAAHFLPWALFERAWAHYYVGELGEAIVCAEECMRISHRKIGGAGPERRRRARVGPRVRAHRVRAARARRGAAGPLVGDDIDGAMPVERGFFWETLALAEAGAGRRERAEHYAARAEADAAAFDLAIPRGVALRRACHARASRRRRRKRRGACRRERARLRVDRRAHRGRLQPRAARPRAGGGRRARRPRSRPCARRSPSWTPAAPRASATPPGGSCASSARAPRSAVRATGAPGGLDALTPRERQIADLVVDRRTNREIGGELFLSEKTIETHLRNIFRKLGASSRVDVARIVEAETTARR